MSVEIAPGLARGGGSAWHGDGPEGAQSLCLTIVGEQKLAAPKCLVVAPTEPIQYHTQYRCRTERAAIFNEAGGHMSMVMLNLDHLQSLGFRELRRQILRMPIDRDHGRSAI